MAYYEENYRNGGYGSRGESMEEEVFSVPVKAGKRIYYFDVKATRNNDFYVTITESRKKQLREGGFAIDKQKLHLYKEDFMKFAAGLQEVLDYIRREKPEFAAAEARGEYDKPYEQRSESVNNSGKSDLF